MAPWADRAETRQGQAGEMAEAVPSLAAAGLDFDMASGGSLERQLLAVSAKLVRVDHLWTLLQLADDTAPCAPWAEGP